MMKGTGSPLPDFNNPPVVEVALSVQFDPLPDLRTPQLGLLWQEFRDAFPVTQEHAPLEPITERFDLPRTRSDPRIDFRESPPLPRCWFLNAAETELIQVQPDRFVHNWRKAGTGEAYPRYGHIRGAFEEELRRFDAFIARERLGKLAPNQCEITYVNHIVAGNVWRTHGELDKVLTVFHRSFSDPFLDSPEDAGLRLRFIIPDESGKPSGRLHVALDSGFRNSDASPLFVLKLTARGQPRDPTILGVLQWLDLGREWVVRGFASVTTPGMHKEWDRQDES